MSPAKSDDPLRKITLNLYDLDVTALESYYGRGWSEEVRRLIHDHVVKIAVYTNVKQKLRDLG